MDLEFDKELYCDNGAYTGQWFVKLHGHLTEKQLAMLKELIESGGAAL